LVALKSRAEGNMKVRDLGVDEFKALIYEAVEEKLEELLGDPDQGLELEEKLKARLKRYLTTESKDVPVEKVARDLGLDW
jgi:vacuolar-type H+-ATPase subunit E/Vma4